MKTIIKFLLIGIVNTVFFYFIYALFIFFEFHYAIATLSATSIGTVFSFRTFGKFVFRNNDNKLLGKFILVTIVNYLLNIIIIFLFKEFGYNNYTAGLIATIIVAFNSFVLNKYYVFVMKDIKV